ncbi:MAG TPA: LapA family protein [Methylophilaceae bacterium]|nr:LapA family protein [Methylophilaceae bacterium]
MRFIYFLAGLLLFILLLGFALKNNTPVELHYYLGYTWRAPLSLLMLITFSCGVLLGIIACISSLIRQRRRNMALERELKALNNTMQSGQSLV